MKHMLCILHYTVSVSVRLCVCMYVFSHVFANVNHCLMFAVALPGTSLKSNASQTSRKQIRNWRQKLQETPESLL